MATTVSDTNELIIINDGNDIYYENKKACSVEFIIHSSASTVRLTFLDTKNVHDILFTDFEDALGNTYSTEETIFAYLSNLLVPGVDATLQDSTSPLMIVKASKIVIETTTTATPTIGDYTIDVASATSFVVGQYLTIYNEPENRVYFSTILSIASLTITLDTPIDFEFPIGSFVSVASTNMNVNGSVTPQIFGIRNPTGVDIPLKFDIVRLMFICLTGGTTDLSKFGDITGGLTRGVVVRRVDGSTQNIFNAKTNGDLHNLMYDFHLEEAKGNAPDGFIGRMTFGGQSKMGAVIRIGSDEDLQIIIQDDLTSLDQFSIIAQGSQVVE